MFKLTIIVAVFIACTFAQPQKPVWPNQFDAAFGLNIPEVNNSNPAIINSSSHFYYNWDIQATLIDYPESCLPFIFAVSGMIILFIFVGILEVRLQTLLQSSWSVPLYP